MANYIHPLPGTVVLTPAAAVLPPLLYYLALLLLPPFSNRLYHIYVVMLRSALALVAALLFFRLPLHYHVPFSAGLTYQLALVGLYGGGRVIDVFFIGPYFWNFIPRRVKYYHDPRAESPGELRRRISNSYFSLHFLQPKQTAIIEKAVTDDGWPNSWIDRASWALELQLSMRGAGFSWSSADVRHTRKTWRPLKWDRAHSIIFRVLPAMGSSWALIRYICIAYLHSDTLTPFEDMPLHAQLMLTAALGAFLMSAFSLAHSASAIMMAPLAPHPLSYFPPLYTLRIWELTSVRGFWSYGWHRLFSRLFLVYGVWPGEWVERKVRRKGSDQAADVGKVLGVFLVSAFVHSFAGYTVAGGVLGDALGEVKFFALCGLAVIAEEFIGRQVLAYRRKQKQRGDSMTPGELGRWYDDYVGRAWWVFVLLIAGRNFAKGWVKAGLIRDIVKI